MKWIDLTDSIPADCEMPIYRHKSRKVPLIEVRNSNNEIVEFRDYMENVVKPEEIEWLDEQHNYVIVPYQKCPICEGSGTVRNLIPYVQLHIDP